MKLITLRTFQFSVDAHLLKSKLESEGIPCFLFDENITTLVPFQGMYSGGIKLKVPESFLEEAKATLVVIDHGKYSNEQDEVLQCPKCGSEDFYANIRSAKGFKKFVNISWMMIFSFLPLSTKSVYECKKCGTQFENN
ncbi:MAG: DNA-directed RNA polymerase subunit RPC12/RpoP [Cyclobacteriaceae bacterium]|jgi:DNA-directed RNA polymerase subunit RPC12/RpoP